MATAREIDRAEWNFRKASEELIEYGGGSGTAPLSKRRGIEARYGATYQRLVALGLRPQIRGKYRP